MKKIKLVDVEVGDKKLDLTRIREAKKYTPYDLVLEDMQEMESIPHMKDILSVKSNQNTWGRIRKTLKRAKKVEDLLALYKQQKKDREEHSLSSATLYWVLEKEIAIKEKELEKLV